MAVFRFLDGLFILTLLGAQAQVFPLKDVRPGMRGLGRTVFSGDRIEEFQVEILGVLENVGPKQSIVLARLAGGPLEKTGLLQGMSGSPVYVDGKLLGAVALGFAFSKEAVAGIRPIEEMLQVQESRRPRPVQALVGASESQLASVFPAGESLPLGEAKLMEIATPVSFGGFTRETLDHFTLQLRSLGLEPRQGVSGGGKVPPRMGKAAALKPGSMITVQLLSGDMSVGADGTVTYVDGNRVYAFGHRMLSVGPTELPFARAEVLTLLPNLASSFKISSPKEWMGTITEDRRAAIAGVLGRRAAMVPVSVSLTRQSAAGPGKPSVYRMEMVNDRFLAPFLLQMVVFSAIDATERTVGTSSFAVKGQIEFQNSAAPIKLNNMYAGDFNLAVQVSLATVLPLAYVLQSGFETLQIKKVDLAIEAFDEKRQTRIDQVWSSRREVRPGETVELTVVLAGANGSEQVKKVSYLVPIGAEPGPLHFTIADGNTMNLMETRQFLNTTPKSAAQLISFVNSLRDNTRAYVRVWRAEQSFEIQGEDLPAPPPSLSMILARSPAALGGPFVGGSSKVAEMEIEAGNTVISGSKSIQVQVKE